MVILAGWNRRSWRLIEEVELLFKEFDLTTSPAFSNAYAHGLIEVKKRNSIAEDTHTNKKQFLICTSAMDHCDPIPRLSRLPSANLRDRVDRNKISLVTVNRESTLEEAITLMIKYNYSQLPIMNTSRRVDGMVSWRSIGKAKCLGKTINRIYDCREDVEVVSIFTPLLEVVEKVQQKEVVLVRDTDEVICGIITAADITGQFLNQAEPFFLIEQIEKMIRIMLNRAQVELEEMLKLMDRNKLDKEIKNVSDFTFGQYLLILQNENMFRKMNLSACRHKLVEYLRRIQEIRNEVMHFAVDETPEEDLRHMRETLHLLTEIIN